MLVYVCLDNFFSLHPLLVGFETHNWGRFRWGHESKSKGTNLKQFETDWTLEWDPPIYFKHMFFGMFILTSTPNYIPFKDKETLVQFMSMWMSPFATPLNYRCLIKTSNRIVPAYHIHKQRCTMDEEELWKLSCGWKVFAQIRHQFQTKIHPYSSSYIP